MNFAAFVPNDEANAFGAGRHLSFNRPMIHVSLRSLDWNQQGNRATVLKAFDSLFLAARKLLSYAPVRIYG